MGAACCCSRDEFEDLADLGSSMYTNCISICFLQNFVHMYASPFQGGEEHVLSPSTQGTASAYPMVSLDNSFFDMYRAPPRPLPYDADPRCFRLHDMQVSRREKGSGHSLEEGKPLTTDEAELLSSKNKWSEFASEEGSKDYNSGLSFNLPNSKAATEFAHIYASSEEEDVCPTCLEEYTPENPRIITECRHHYHLGCIYEWMERSDKCPVCGKGGSRKENLRETGLNIASLSTEQQATLNTT